MPRDFFDLTPEQPNVTLIDAAILREAERLIEFWREILEKTLSEPA